MIGQIIIAITGVVAIFLTQSENKSTQRYACLFGLAGQPFWIMATWETQQWGMFILTLFYTLAWLKGLKMYWLKELNVLSVIKKMCFGNN